MNETHCIFGCDHERHHPYHEKFDRAQRDNTERQYYWNVAKYVLDSKVSPSDGDDLELFEDAIFESPWGRIHIHFYEWLFQNYYKTQPEVVIRIFINYLGYLEKLSVLFVNDAFDFVFRQEDPKLIETLLKVSPLSIKLQIIRVAEKYPQAIQSVPKLKLYNLFS
jgi:hypothetical protein